MNISEMKKKVLISDKVVRKGYKEIRDIIYRYYLKVYESEPLGLLNEHKYFSYDESLFYHTKDHSQVYVLCIINNSKKRFTTGRNYFKRLINT